MFGLSFSFFMFWEILEHRFQTNIKSMEDDVAADALDPLQDGVAADALDPGVQQAELEIMETR